MAIWHDLRARIGLVLPGAKERRDQIESYAAAWASHNDRVRTSGSGRRWVALGDSTSQGIGATAHDRGWVGQLLASLGDDWHVVNLSVSGATSGDVLTTQLPHVADLGTVDLVTCAVGANDLLRGRAATVRRDLERLVGALPDGTVVATIPQGIRAAAARSANDGIVEVAAARGLRVADVWGHTGPPYGGKYFADGFHPNDVGYIEWADAFREALGLPVVGGGTPDT